MGQKYNVRLEPVGIEFEVDEDETVLRGAFRQGRRGLGDEIEKGIEPENHERESEQNPRDRWEKAGE